MADKPVIKVILRCLFIISCFFYLLFKESCFSLDVIGLMALLHNIPMSKQLRQLTVCVGFN